MKKYVVKGLYTMVVEAGNGPEAKQTSERILRHEGVKAVAVEAEGVAKNEATKNQTT